MKKDPVFIIGGILMGLFAAFPFISMGIVCAEFWKNKWLLLPFSIGAAGIFILIQYIVYGKKNQKLKNFYLMSAVVSFGAVILMIRIWQRVGQNVIIRFFSCLENDKSGISGMVFLYAAVLVSVGIFICVFSFVTKWKAEYIRKISEEVSRIAKGEEEIRLEVKGNDELAVLSETINRMNAELKESGRKQKRMEQQKNELISNVSHDLRSPLTSIIGYVQLLAGYKDVNDDRYSEYIEVIDRRLEGLDKLINELFELTKMDSPNFTLRLEPGDVTAFVKQFGYEMKAVLKQNGLELTSNIDNREFMTLVDFERLARVMENLFANVIKYAEKNSEVFLESLIDEERIRISLVNVVRAGSAIDTENMFDRLYKEDRARTDISSTGLGLAIAKKIIELHGGTITAALQDDMIRMEIELKHRQMADTHGLE